MYISIPLRFFPSHRMRRGTARRRAAGRVYPQCNSAELWHDISYESAWRRTSQWRNAPDPLWKNFNTTSHVLHNVSQLWLFTYFQRLTFYVRGKTRFYVFAPSLNIRNNWKLGPTARRLDILQPTIVRFKGKQHVPKPWNIAAVASQRNMRNENLKHGSKFRSQK